MKIAFGIVVYKELFYKTSAFISLLKSMRESGTTECPVFIYDNTDTPGWQAAGHKEHNEQNLIYFHNPLNPGISVAYNYMAGLAAKSGYEWMVFLDQDTDLPVNALAEYRRSIARNPGISVKAPVLYVRQKVFSPMRFIFKRSLELKNPLPGIYSFRNKMAVNSGLMVSLSLFFKAGGYNEAVKLDFADFQFLERAKKHVAEFEILNIACEHHFSHFETDIQKALARYAIFVKDLENCEKKGGLEELNYWLINVLHLVKLSLKFRTFRFLKIFLG